MTAAGYDKAFRAVFQDWVVANFLDEDQGIYGYADLQVLVSESRVMHEFGELERDVPQYGTHYIEIAPKLHDQPLRFRFEGVAENRLLPTEVPETGCWWSNSGDSITSSLSRTVDLTALSQATFTYEVWYSIEEEWDYVYLQVSEDGGQRWEILETSYTSAANPVGTAFGPGYTGKSREWLTERIDLNAYAGSEIQVRFQYVTDDALNDIGLCLREIALPEAGISAGDRGWQAQGFIQTDNRVQQDYIVQIIQKGEENRVTTLPLTADGYGALRGEVVVTPYPGPEADDGGSLSGGSPDTRKIPLQTCRSSSRPIAGSRGSRVLFPPCHSNEAKRRKHPKSQRLHRWQGRTSNSPELRGFPRVRRPVVPAQAGTTDTSTLNSYPDNPCPEGFWIPRFARNDSYRIGKTVRRGAGY